MMKATYVINDAFEEAVANALPDAPRVKAELTSTANRVRAGAQANIAQAPKADPRDAKNVEEVASQLGFLSAKDYFRKQVFPGTRIPVVLVVSDAWQSKWYEFGKGRGNHFPAMHFLRNAGRAAVKSGMTWRGRGRSRGGSK
jgi:hypothetical protein